MAAGSSLSIESWDGHHPAIGWQGASVTVANTNLRCGSAYVRALTALVVGRLGGAYLMFTLPMIDIGIYQDPMLVSGEQPLWMKLLPGFGGTRLVLDAGFTSGFDEWSALAAALAWLAGSWRLSSTSCQHPARVNWSRMTETITPLLESRERFLAFLRSKLNDPDLAEDLLQESLLKAVRAAPNLRAEEQLVPWFFAILRNAVTDAYRRQGRAPDLADLSLAADVPQTEEEQHNACTCFEALLPALKPEYAELIHTLDLGEETAEQARQRLGVSATNLKVRHHRARQALRRKLEETCRVCAEHHCLDCTCERSLSTQV